MSRIHTIAAVAALGISTGACAPTPQPHLAAANNPSVYSVHQPVVQRTDYVLDVAAGVEGISAAERARLDAWFNSIELRYGDSVTIDESRGYESAAARRDIALVAAQHGLLLSDGAPLTPGAVPPGTVRVIASRTTASVPGCPVWASKDIAPQSNTSSNFGCATNSNLAAMIADPNDLIHGRDGSVSGASTALRAIRTYREGQPTGRQGLQQTSTSGR